MNPQTLFNRALQLHQAGHLEEAVQLYRQLLQALPQAVEVTFNLGNALLAQGRNTEAADCFRQLIRRQPKLAAAHAGLGNALAAAGDPAAAAQAFRQAIQYQPDFAEAHMNLGNALAAQGEHDQAIARLLQATKLKPGLAIAHFNLGNACRQADRLEAAEAAYRQALALAPGHFDSKLNLGVVLSALDRHEEAVACYGQVLADRPSHAEAHFNLGVALGKLGWRRKAMDSYRRCLECSPRHFQAWTNLGLMLRAEGKVQDAIDCYRRAAEIQPDNVRAYNNLVQILIEYQQYDLAIEGCEKALAIEPDNVNVLRSLGEAYREKKDSTAALPPLERAMALGPEDVRTLAALAGVYSSVGRLAEGISLYRQALVMNPEEAGVHDGLLFDLCHLEGVSREEVFAAHLAYGQQFEKADSMNRRAWPNGREPARRLRLGFLSGDFFAHPVAAFIEPVWQALDPQQVELFAYSNRFREDAVTARLKALAPHWQCVAGLDDDELDTRIRADGIDILIDLSGHTSGNRLPVLARKPAPLQASWIGFPSTTGLHAVDYYLADGWASPPGLLDDYFTEKLVRLPCIATFQHAENAPDINALPALRNGFLTFGSFNKPQKLGPLTLSLWIRVLLAIPDARMVFAAMSDPALQDAILTRFTASGIEPGRLAFRPNLPFDQYLVLHHEVDIALDPLAFNGWTTTNHALWMGVPWITRMGNTLASRAGGGATLHHLGLDAFVAEDEEGYIAIARHWSQNLPELAQIRRGMRERISGSPLREPDKVARGLEKALREMWRRWCRGEPPTSFAVEAE